MIVQFFYEAVQEGVDESGVPNYIDVPFIRITRDITHTVTRRMEEDDQDLYPDHWKFFLKSTAKYEPLEGGLPLEMWPVASPAEVMNLKGHGFRTVQDLAKMVQSKKEKLPPSFVALVEHSRNYLKVAGAAAQATETMSRLTDENKQLREELGLARSEIQILKRQLTEKAA
jgi:hypothetical protein